MTTGYIVAWTGGYDAPQYAYRDTRTEAFNLAAEYLRDFDPACDTIDVLAIDTNAQTIERIEAGTCSTCTARVVRDDHGTLIDLDTGGDVCGALGDNEPHTINERTQT